MSVSDHPNVLARALYLVVGGVLLLAGIALLVLPGPGLLLVLGGLLVLALLIALGVWRRHRQRYRGFARRREIRATLSQLPVKTRVSLTGPLVVARDIAHAKIAERLDAGEPMPAYLRDHPVYYAGPAKTPKGYASGSFGPTTAGRMDSYVEQFQAAGGSMVMLAKGNRSRQVREACKKYGGFYLGSIGGAAANLAEHCIKKVEVVEYPELGMEAIWRIEVVDFPAFIIVDDKGNDFFKELNLG